MRAMPPRRSLPAPERANPAALRAGQRRHASRNGERTPSPRSDQPPQFPVAADLRNRFLLHVASKPGWHPTSELLLWLAPRLKIEIAEQRYLAAGGVKDVQLSTRIGEGQKLYLHDLIALTRKQKLVEVRSADTGDEIRSTPWQDSRFTIDPILDKFLARSPIEVDKLTELLLVEGCQQPLVVWKERGLLIDGHTRYRVLSILGMLYKIRFMSFDNIAAVMDYIRLVHLGRRNLGEAALSYLRGTHLLGIELQHGGDRTGARSDGRTLVKSARELATYYGVARSTLFQDARFSEALDLVDETCDGNDIREKVLARVLPWTRRDVLNLAKLDEARRRAIVRKAIKRDARPTIPRVGENDKHAIIKLPVRDPRAQLRVLEEKLGAGGLHRMWQIYARSRDARSERTN